MLKIVFRYLFWTDSGKPSSIERSSLSGDNRKAIAYVSGLGSELAIDHSTNRLHVVDYRKKYLISVDLDGNDLQYHASLDGVFLKGLAVVPGRQTYYYSSVFTDAVYVRHYDYASFYDESKSVYKTPFDEVGQVQIPVKSKQNGNISVFLLTFHDIAYPSVTLKLYMLTDVLFDRVLGME